MPRFKSHRLKKEEERDDGSVPPHDALIDESPSLSFSMKEKGKGSSSKFWSRRSNSNTKKTAIVKNQKSKLNGSFVSKSSTTTGSRASLASLSSVVKSCKASISSSLSPSKVNPPSPPRRGRDTNNDDNNTDDNNYSLLAETMPLFELNIETSSLLSEDQAQQMCNDTNTHTDNHNHNQEVDQQQHEIRDTIIIEDDENNNNNSNNFSNNTPCFRILKRLDDEKTEETEEDEEEEEQHQLQTVDTTCTNEDNQISYFFEDSMSTIDPVSSVAGGTGEDGSDSVGSLSLSPSVHVPLAASSRASSTTWGPALAPPVPLTLPPQTIPNYTTHTNDTDHDYTFTPIFDGQFDDSTTHEKEFFTETPPPLPVSQRRSTNKKKHQHQHQPQNEFAGSDSCGGGSSSPLAGETILSALEQEGVDDTTKAFGTSRLSPLSCSGGGTSPTDMKTEFTDSFRQIQHQFQLLLLSSTSKSTSASQVSPTKTKTERNHKNNNNSNSNLNLNDEKSVYTDDLIAPMCSVGPLKCFYYSDGGCADTDRPDECLTYDTDAAIHYDESRHSVVTTAVKNVTTALQHRQQHHQEQQQHEPPQSQSRCLGGSGNMCGGGGGGSVVGFPDFDYSQWDPVVETKSSF